MSPLRICCLLALSAAALLVAPVLSAADDEFPPPEQPLTRWLRDYRRGRLELDVPGLKQLRLLVESVADQALIAPIEEPEVAGEMPSRGLELAYLDLAGLDLAERKHSERNGEPENALIDRARNFGREELHALLDGDAGAELADWLCQAVISSSRAPMGQRIAATTLFEGRHLPQSKSVLLEIAGVEKKARLRNAALKALVGWAEPEITRFILSGVNLEGRKRKQGLPVPLSVATDHLRRINAVPLAEGLQAEILEFLAPTLTSESWREASRGLELSRALTSDAVYPVLIDALEAWIGRRGGHLASRRLENDILDQLTGRSSRFLGDRPERWRNWWRLVEAGEVPPPPKAGEDDGSSRASFFSLRPVTQRVTFIIDRSGSMSAPFGSEQLHSRFQEAADQTIGFLELSGEDTEFNVILFSTEHLRWKSRLRLATTRNLDALRSWLADNGPGGGTNLRDAVEDALELRRDGTADLNRLRSDTMIILCDGDTDSGSDWVVPTLAKIKESARLVFHCVRIGNSGDGTLELLARESGGDFIHIKR